MNKITNCLKSLNIFFILFLLSSCNEASNFNKTKKKNDPLINSQKINKKNKLEITISCNEESIDKYLKDGWKIKNKKSKEKFTTERLHDDYRKMFKSDPCIMYCEKDNPSISNGYV